MRAFDLVRPFFVKHKGVIAAGLLSLIVVDLSQLMIPRVIKSVVDALTVNEIDTIGLLRHAAVLVLLAVIIGVFRYVWRRCLLGAARRLEESLRNQFFAHIQTLSADYFDGVKTGDLMAHATNDINQVRMAAGMGLVAFNDAVVLGAAAIGFMLYIHVPLTLYVLIPMPLIVIGTRLLGRRMHHRYQDVQAAFSDLTEMVRERFSGIRIIKAHSGQVAATRSVQDASQAYVTQNIRLVGVTGLFFPLMVLLTNLSLAIVLYFGGRRAVLLDISAGDFVAFISYLNLLTWPMMALGWVTNLIQRGGASLTRLKAILDRRPAIASLPGAVALPRVRGDIVFEAVEFSYTTDQTRPVLEDISFAAAAGEIIAFVGPPGSGKSTLLSLVPRLYDVNRGQIRIDGRDVRDIILDDLRRQIAYAPQEPFLFAGSVRDNVLFGCPGDCAGRLDQILADTGLTQTIASFPAGLDTIVGEKGILLSGGQKQRIALARALLADTPIVLLDDPISQVDTATAARIIQTLRGMAGRKTVLIASHRLAAVRFADRIISLDQGRMIENGTHEDLITASGYYAGVHALQELDDAV